MEGWEPEMAKQGTFMKVRLNGLSWVLARRQAAMSIRKRRGSGCLGVKLAQHSIEPGSKQNNER